MLIRYLTLCLLLSPLGAAGFCDIHVAPTPPTVTILCKTNGTYDVGSTADLNERFQRHNQGRSRYTKRGLPWKLVHAEQFATRAQATQRERRIKNRKSRDYIEDLVRTSR